ncbi:MAG: LEA type 2 family protein [Betaproteobacteria bacterium]|nr:LEA type 2 family protein [Betaproteobacteria bacterium]
MAARRFPPGLPWLPMAALLLVTACAALYGLKSPNVSVTAIEVRELRLLEQKFRVQVRVQNPNDVDIAVNGMSFELELNGKPFATGVSNQVVTVPRYGTGTVEVEVVSGVREVLRQFLDGKKEVPSRWPYRLRGQVSLVQPYSLTIPYDTTGEIDLGRFGGVPR